MTAAQVTNVIIRKPDSGDGLLAVPERVVEITFCDATGKSNSAVYPREEVIDWLRKWLASWT